MQNAKAWRVQLNKVEKADEFPAKQREFINALAVCVRTYEESYRIPRSVSARIDEWQSKLKAEPDHELLDVEAQTNRTHTRGSQ